MKSLWSLALLLLLLFASPVWACDTSTRCEQCKGTGEFAWNPENQSVSPRLSRFYALRDEVETAYKNGDDSRLKKLTDEYLSLAAVYRCNWNYGNAIHDANSYLGLASLRRGNVDEAATFLEAAGKSTGSPQLDTFGPDLSLANALLKKRKINAVKQYLNDVKRFWDMNNGKIDEWLAAIDRGEEPELDRFYFKPSPWVIALGWFVLVWPALIACALLYIGRNTIKRKIVFFVAAAAGGYVCSFLINWVYGQIVMHIASFLPSGGFGIQIFAFYLPVSAALITASFAEWAVYGYFSKRTK